TLRGGRPPRTPEFGTSGCLPDGQEVSGTSSGTSSATVSSEPKGLAPRPGSTPGGPRPYEVFGTSSRDPPAGIRPQRGVFAASAGQPRPWSRRSGGPRP